MTNTELREKLVDMIVHYCDRVGYPDCKENCTLCLADYMIANGVTFKEECYNCGSATQEVIAKLQSDIADLRKSQTWISVKERLPEEDGEYITMTNAKGKVNGVLSQKYNTSYVRGKKLRRWYWLGNLSPWEITHWMPLPEPPKGELI